MLIGFWTEPDPQYILIPTPICPSVINPDHYQIPSTMSPTPQHDISNWIAFQTQHMQIKLFILLPRWDFLNKFLGRVFFPKLLGLELLGHLSFITDYLLNPIPWLHVIALSYKSAIFNFYLCV